MTPQAFIEAARVPKSLKPQSFGPWRIDRCEAMELMTRAMPLSLWNRFKVTSRLGFDSYTLLRRLSWATMHLHDPTEIVMEDSLSELRTHLPIWLAAKGTVLVTGLGLGCVVRGLLAKKEVEQITVVEIDKSILRVVGHEFEGNRRVELIHGDAFKVQFGKRRFNYAWHDLWTDGDKHLSVLHMQLVCRFFKLCSRQGAWKLPRLVRRASTSELRDYLL